MATHIVTPSYPRSYILGSVFMNVVLLALIELASNRALGWSYDLNLVRAIFYAAPFLCLLATGLQVKELREGNKVRAASLQGAFLGMATVTVVLVMSLAHR